MSDFPEFRKVFPKVPVFLPVIHVRTPKQALENARIAKDGGADGAFLINHDFDYSDTPTSLLLQCYEEVRAHYPEWWIGLNFLQRNHAAIKLISASASGLWVDNAGIEENNADPVKEARELLEERLAQGASWHALYFGGVAFKGNKPVKDLPRVATLAAPFVDVVTTSGPGTGFPPTVEKMRVFREAVGEKPLAVASGITASNIRPFLPFVDAFLVASGISDSFEELNPTKTWGLGKIIHGYQQ
jgi:uncharacterized protein